MRIRRKRRMDMTVADLHGHNMTRMDTGFQAPSSSGHMKRKSRKRQNPFRHCNPLHCPLFGLLSRTFHPVTGHDGSLRGGTSVLVSALHIVLMCDGCGMLHVPPGLLVHLSCFMHPAIGPWIPDGKIGEAIALPEPLFHTATPLLVPARPPSAARAGKVSGQSPASRASMTQRI